eukprot:170745_1
MACILKACFEYIQKFISMIKCLRYALVFLFILTVVSVVTIFIQVTTDHAHVVTHTAMTKHTRAHTHTNDGDTLINKSTLFYNLFSTRNDTRALCNNTQIERDEGDHNEPETHICLDYLSPPCTVLSFGIAYDFSFDDMMLEKRCSVYSFDPSMKRANYTRHKNHKFYFQGIGNIDGKHTGATTLWGNVNDYNVSTLDTIMKMNNIKYVDVIRMDIESAEWDVLESWLNNKMFKHIGQLLLEIHMYQTNGNDLNRFMDILTNIPMTVFWVQRNKWNNRKMYKDITQVYEFDMIH